MLSLSWFFVGKWKFVCLFCAKFQNHKESDYNICRILIRLAWLTFYLLRMVVKIEQRQKHAFVYLFHLSTASRKINVSEANRIGILHICRLCIINVAILGKKENLHTEKSRIMSRWNSDRVTVNLNYWYRNLKFEYYKKIVCSLIYLQSEMEIDWRYLSEFHFERSRSSYFSLCMTFWMISSVQNSVK